MTASEQNYGLILAGGVGSRLWPTSREHMPKQFLDIGGTGRTLLQQTYDRFARFINPAHIFVSTQVGYLPIVNKQLPQLPREQILAEPVRRGTLAPVSWATSAIINLCPNACIVVSPADQVIYGDDLFDDDLKHGLDMVSHNEGVLILGVNPIRPETGYGYVQAGEPVVGSDRIFQVKTFTEKPNADFARLFMESGEFLWNTGLFIFGAHYMLHNIIKHVPAYSDEFPELTSERSSTAIVPRFYEALPNLSMEHALLEHTGHRYVQRCRFGWADLGTWEGIASDAIHAPSRNTPRPPSDVKTDGRGNVTLHSEALFDNANDNIVRLPDGHLAVISGLDGYVITEESGVLMICPKNDSAAMRRLHTLAHLDEF